MIGIRFRMWTLCVAASALIGLVGCGDSGDSGGSGGGDDQICPTGYVLQGTGANAVCVLKGTSGTGPHGGPDGGTVGTDGGAVGTDGGTVGTDGGDPPVPGTAADLRVDNNRNGVIDPDDPTEDEGEETWDESHGAIFLANIDDDEDECPKWGQDVDLAACFDAADEVVNGDTDWDDMAQVWMGPFAAAADGATGSLELSASHGSKVRFFRTDGTVFKPAIESLTTEEVRAGMTLLMEGLDIVRDGKAWDGYIDITYSINGSGAIASDTVRMRVAPVMLYHHLLDSEVVYVSSSKFWGAESDEFKADIQGAITSANSPASFFELKTADQWAQDYFELGYMSMPNADGGQKTIRVAFRSANVYNPDKPDNPLRPAGQLVYTHLHGPDMAGVTEFDINHDGYMDSLNSFGNTETIPPYSYAGVDYPLGRIFRGSAPGFYPDPDFSRMLESQEIQPHVYIDTSFLLVGHVDEVFSFIHADTERGWYLVMNDPIMGKELFQAQVDAGNGDVKMFKGKWWDAGVPAEISIKDVLADPEIMEESDITAGHINAALAIIQAETGITEEEIIRIPYLHEPVSGYSVAYQPGTVNGQHLDGHNFLPPNPHGPVIDGKDIMKAQMEEAFGAVGYTIHWVEDWDLYHRLLGEVHCGSNTQREIPAVKWWETGR